MLRISNAFHKKDFWLEENLRYSEVHYSLEKCARIVNALSRGRRCDLLDVGCGPATLAKLLQKNINYFGIDIAIHDPAPNLLEMDITQNEIRFGSKTFDIIVMRGFLEYLGGLQREKLAETQRILNKDGKFVVSYLNFSHLHGPQMDKVSIYNNIQPIEDLKRDLELFFHIERCFPSSHNWHRSEPRRIWLCRIQMPLKVTIPIISRMLAVQYFLICSSKHER